MRAQMLAGSRRMVFAAAIAMLGADLVSAQLPNASPAAYGMAGNYTAMARGYEAIAWNASNLAMPGRPFISIGVGSVGGTLGMDPIGFGMLHAAADPAGVLPVDSITRASWVNLVRTAGRQRTRIDGGVTALGLTVGPIGIQAGVSLYSNADFSPDMFEGMVFGNAGLNNGAAKPLSFTGTGLEVAAFGSGALSFALPLPIRFTGGLLGEEHFAIGVTGKYIVGEMAVAQDAGSVFGTSSVDYSLPGVAPKWILNKDSSDYAPSGTGVGADLSASWSVGRWKVGAMVENVFNSFKWDTTLFGVKAVAGHFDADTSYTSPSDSTLPLSAAPLALREKITNQKFMPAINIGMAFKPTAFLTITGDFHQQLGGDDAISIGPKNRVGVGAELRILPFIPLRAGVASVTDGWQAAGGFGFHFLGYELGISGSVRKRGAATESGLMVNVLGIGH
jgi:hypothetical protein